MHAVFCVLEEEGTEVEGAPKFSKSFAHQLADLTWECALRPDPRRRGATL